MPLLDRWTAPLSPARAALELQSEHLEGFRRSQAMAYAAVTAVEKELREGMTERHVAGLVAAYLADHGVFEYFHTPFAWFGDRTAFTHFKTKGAFAPTERRLKAGDPVILDVAPVIDGHASDVGYSCALGENKLQRQMALDLVEYRSIILDGVKAGRTRSAIYRDVDRAIERQGYENRHQKYPNRVIGHRVTWSPEHERSRKTVMGFGLTTFKTVLAINVVSMFDKQFDSPEWNDLAPSDKRCAPGLWAIEPHIGFMGTGAKWEEILVITESDAYWLDDDVPHVRRLRAQHQLGEAAE